MSMMRKRAEAARRNRIDHVFVKADDNSNGKITPQQMIKLFAANGEVIIIFGIRLFIHYKRFFCGIDITSIVYFSIILNKYCRP